MNARYLPILLIGIGLFNAADYFFTVQALSMGATEANPVMDAIVHTPLFPMVKLFLVPVFLLFIWVVRAKIERLHKPVMIMLWVVFIGYFSVTVYHIFMQYRI